MARGSADLFFRVVWLPPPGALPSGLSQCIYDFATGAPRGPLSLSGCAVEHQLGARLTRALNFRFSSERRHFGGARGKADLWEDGCATTVGTGADAAGSAATRCDVSTVHPRAPACHIPSPVFLETFRNRTPMEPHLWRSATHSEAAVRSTFPSSAVPGPSTLGTSCCGRSGGAALTPPRT